MADVVANGVRFNVSRLGVPGRHEAGGGYFGDLPRAFTHILIGEQRERPNLTRPMAGSAILKNDRGDVLGERGRPGSRVSARRAASGDKDRDQRREDKLGRHGLAAMPANRGIRILAFVVHSDFGFSSFGMERRGFWLFASSTAGR